MIPKNKASNTIISSFPADDYAYQLAGKVVREVFEVLWGIEESFRERLIGKEVKAIERIEKRESLDLDEIKRNAVNHPMVV